VKNLLIIFFVFITALVQAQNGKIRGTVIDDATGETLVGVTVFIKGTQTGTITDLDGMFTINLAEGLYDVQISYISYETLIIEGVQVKDNDVTVMGELHLGQNMMDIEEVVVKAEVIRTTETAIQTMKKKSTVMLDGISASKMSLIGDATAVEAAKRITGVSVQDGKYIYVRGLGDRYSKTILNGMDIPGLDPDKNSIQMDIFPTNLINNMMVSKNFTADMPADFTGGIMNVETKDFPDRKIFSVSLATSYNPDMHFNSDYLSYDGGALDFLGFDDGTRKLPSLAKQEDIPSPITYWTKGYSSDEINNFFNSFTSTLGASNKLNPMDFSLGLSYGNQIELNSNNEKFMKRSPKLGIIFSASYKAQYKYYDERSYGEYQLNSDASEYDLVYATLQNGSLGEHEVLIGLMGGLAFKTNYSKIRFTAMRLQSGESKAGKFTIDNNEDATGQSGYYAVSDNLEYSQRSLTNVFLGGSHVLKHSGWDLDWRIAPTFSTSDDPDIRKTPFTIADDGDISFSSGAGGNPSRTWRELQEINLSNKIDITKKYQFKGSEAKLKFGGAYNYKKRNYEIVSYDILNNSGTAYWDDTDANAVLQQANMWYYGSDNDLQLYYSTDYTQPNPNEYEANVSSFAVYISNEINLSAKLKSNLGLRLENYVLRHTGRDQEGASGSTGGNVLNNEKVLDLLDLFPSVNFIYSLNDDQNLRATFSRTTARPSFKELSYAQILDPLSNSIYNGGLHQYDDWDGQLVSTYINNIDLRWEMFKQKGQMLSVSAFFKTFEDPIELVRIPEAQTSTEYQTRNVGDGQLLGAEFEFRKELDFIGLSDFNLSSNLTIVESQIEMTNTEYESRKNQERDGQNIDNKRVMAGQAPYVVNAGLTYGNKVARLDAGLFYNVKGKTLSIVGGGIYPDVYTNPFHSLNFSLNKKLGNEGKSTFEFKVANIMGNDYQEVYTSYKADDVLHEKYSPGRSFSLGYKYKF
jgi:TonB-dependent receptor